MGDEKSFEDYRKMYTGKELADCFANLHMTINNEIRTVKQEIKETNERVGVLESHAELVNDLIKTLNEETVPNLEDKLNEEANERIRLELWGRKWNVVIGGIEGTLNETPRVTEKKVRDSLKLCCVCPRKKQTLFSSKQFIDFQVVHMIKNVESL
jgi:N-methylhydantoinase B/oxoprolinase/acetone carboxylase alpha subunit